MVGFDCGEAAHTAAREAGLAVEFHRLQGVEHSSCLEELQAVARFVHAVLAADSKSPPPCVPQWERPGALTSGGSESEDDGAVDILYACKRRMEALRGQLAKGIEPSAESLRELTDLDDLGDDEVMVPVDTSGFGPDFDDQDDLLEKLGPRGLAEAIIGGADKLATARSEAPGPHVPLPMTLKELREAEESESAESSACLEETGEEEEGDGGGDVPAEDAGAVHGSKPPEEEGRDSATAADAEQSTSTAPAPKKAKSS